MEDKKYAVLIDADNVSARYLSVILDELTKYGVTTYRRIYGDWTDSHTAKWRNMLLENSITPIQQFANTIGKNATDSTLIIDAMDILYTGNVDGFCIVSSDGDFTRLASRLRESGMQVIGMGEEKTPRSFRSACNVFTTLENLIDQAEETEQTEEVPSKNEKNKNVSFSKKIIENTIVGIITENENKGKVTGLGEIGSRLVNKYPDFDVRNYGYSLLSKFLEEIDGVELKKINSTVLVELKENNKSKGDIIAYIIAMVNASGRDGININEISNRVHARYKNFSPKDYGYSQFLKFVQSIKGIVITDDEMKRKIAKPKNKKR